MKGWAALHVQAHYALYIALRKNCATRKLAPFDGMPACWSVALEQRVFVPQASAVQERFQAAVMDFQELLTVTNIVKLWVQALQ